MVVRLTGITYGRFSKMKKVTISQLPFIYDIITLFPVKQNVLSGKRKHGHNRKTRKPVIFYATVLLYQILKPL